MKKIGEYETTQEDDNKHPKRNIGFDDKDVFYKDEG
jgi:hypothetical protein